MSVESQNIELFSQNPESIPGIDAQQFILENGDYIKKTCAYEVGQLRGVQKGAIDPEELYHTVVAKLLSGSLQHYREGGGKKAWLQTVVQNKLLDLLNKLNRIKAHEQKWGDNNVDNIDGWGVESIADTTVLLPDDALHLRQRDESIQRAVASLPEKLRAVIECFYFQELNYDEIAKQLDINTGTVKSRLNRAKVLLKDKLKLLPPKKD